MKGKFESIPEILANCSNNGTLPMILSILQYGNCTSGNVKKKLKLQELTFLAFWMNTHSFILAEIDFSGMPQKHKELFCVSIT